MARLDKGHSGVMENEGKRIRERRTALGMSQEDLANEAGVNRDTVGAIENGLGFRRSSLTKIEEALSRVEEEAGVNAPAATATTEPGLVTFRLSGQFGVDVVVQGPVSNLAELESSVEKLLRQLKGSEKEDEE